MNLQNKTVLVTGGAGYIGSHTCKALSAAGFLPVAYDKLIYGHRYAVKWGPLEIGDIRDRARLDDILVKYQPVAVLHFAAFAYVGESVLEPGKYYTNNLVGTLELLEAMRARGINSIVFSSTCATYGIPAEQPITEQMRQEPVNPYGRSKLMIERILADYSAAYVSAFSPRPADGIPTSTLAGSDSRVLTCRLNIAKRGHQLPGRAQDLLCRRGS